MNNAQIAFVTMIGSWVIGALIFPWIVGDGRIEVIGIGALFGMAMWVVTVIGIILFSD